jgi:hypothetical protein
MKGAEVTLTVLTTWHFNTCPEPARVTMAFSFLRSKMSARPATGCSSPDLHAQVLGYRSCFEIDSLSSGWDVARELIFLVWWRCKAFLMGTRVESRGPQKASRFSSASEGRVGEGLKRAQGLVRWRSGS